MDRKVHGVRVDYEGSETGRHGSGHDPRGVSLLILFRGPRTTKRDRWLSGPRRYLLPSRTSLYYLFVPSVQPGESVPLETYP